MTTSREAPGMYDHLNLEVLRRFAPAFQAGERQGNAERAFNRELRSSGDEGAARAIAAGVLAEGESCVIDRHGTRFDGTHPDPYEVTGQERQPWEQEAPQGATGSFAGFGNDLRVKD